MDVRGINDLRSLGDIRTVLTIHAGSLPGSGKRISKIQLQLHKLKSLIHREEVLNRRQCIIMARLEWVRRQESNLGRQRKKLLLMQAIIKQDKLALLREIQRIGERLACN